MPYTNVGSCDGICPARGTRCSPCPQLSTEDNRTEIRNGMRLYNYYDGVWGNVLLLESTPQDGWFWLVHDDGTHDLLNGARCSTREV